MTLEIERGTEVNLFPASSSQDDLFNGEAEEALELELDEENDIRFEIDNVIQKFRGAVSDLGLDDHKMSDKELLRWLRARSMDIEKAEEMLRKSIKWRKDHEIDSIFDWKPPPHFYKEFPFQICGFDNDGDQFGVVTWSKWNMDDFIQSVPKDQGKSHIRYFWQCLEVIKKIMRAHSTEEKTIYNGIVIIDMEGLSVTQFASREVVEVVLEATRQFEANYPGFLKRAIVVNAPQIFSLLYQIMRPFLSEETVSCVEIHGYYDDWRSVLRNNHGIPVELLPSRHGGANTVVKPYHPSHGHYLTFPKHENVVEESNLKCVNVPAGQKLDIDFNMEKNKKLSWAFRTDDYDIGFGVFHISENDGTEVEVVDFCRVDSQILMQRGSIVCEESGQYIVRFDNISSWIRPKTLHYIIEKSE